MVFKNNFFILFILFFVGFQHYGQDKKITKNGTVVFEASMPSFEEVKAETKSASCVINTKTGEIASLILIKSFRFKIALMEEHFNENYIESDKYPKAIFKGNIVDFDYSKLSNDTKKFKLVGTMEMHGISNEVEFFGDIAKKGNGITLKSKFTLNTDDYGIKIPKIVDKKVSKKVQVSLDYYLE